MGERVGLEPDVQRCAIGGEHQIFAGRHQGMQLERPAGFGVGAKHDVGRQASQFIRAHPQIQIGHAGEPDEGCRREIELRQERRAGRGASESCGDIEVGRDDGYFQNDLGRAIG